jgi:hypothetical protein
MTKLNMSAETIKPQTAPSPGDAVKQDGVKAPTAPLATPAAPTNVDQK